MSSTGRGTLVAIFGYGGARSTAMTTLRSLPDLLAIVPYLLGFHPADSVVMLALQGREVVFQARADLPEPDEVPELAARLAELLGRQEPTSAIVLGYGTGDAVTPLVRAVQEALEDAGIPVLDVLRVAGGRYWSYLCAEPSCCPADGTPYDVAASPAAVEAVLAGYVALPTRAELARRLDPVEGAARSAMGAATVRARERLTTRPRLARSGRADVDKAVRRQGAGIAPTDDEVAWLTVLLQRPPVRDHAWDSVTADVDAHVRLWTEVVRRAEPDLVAAPAALLSFAAWQAGEGAIASLALARALAADPDDPMAALMAKALGFGLSPRELTR